ETRIPDFGDLSRYTAFSAWSGGAAWKLYGKDNRKRKELHAAAYSQNGSPGESVRRRFATPVWIGDWHRRSYESELRRAATSPKFARAVERCEGSCEGSAIGSEHCLFGARSSVTGR